MLLVQSLDKGIYKTSLSPNSIISITVDNELNKLKGTELQMPASSYTNVTWAPNHGGKINVGILFAVFWFLATRWERRFETELFFAYRLKAPKFFREEFLP